MSTPTHSRSPITVFEEVTIRFAGDSGDGMQLTGTQFSSTSATVGNDLNTFPDFPSEIRAPQGTTYGVSSFQIHLGSKHINTPGDECDVLIAMNAAALKVNLTNVKPRGTIIINTNGFDKKSLQLAKYDINPLEDESLAGYKVFEVEITRLTKMALASVKVAPKVAERTKNFYALGLMYWLFSRPLQPTLKWLEDKFHDKNDVLMANTLALKAGWNYGETTEMWSERYDVRPASLPPGSYRNMNGNLAVALGLTAAADKAKLPLFLGSYPITPASDILHHMSSWKRFNIRTFQAEDEIAGITSAIGASYGGAIGVTTTSGPGLALKTEAIGLAVMTELPLVIVNVQRAGPSTGLPTKTEQADLLQALYGRNGEAPCAVIAPATPSECFDYAFQAVRIALQSMSPVFLLTDGYLANSSEPWRIPEVSSLPDISVPSMEPTASEEAIANFQPYARNEETLARTWVVPGMKGFEHRIGGLEKQDKTGNVSYDPDNHEQMVQLRSEKIARIANYLPPAIVEGDEKGDVLVVGWGGTYGAIKTAVESKCASGLAVAHLHLRYINPLQHNVGEILRRFKHVIVAELNNGQLIHLLRSTFLIDAQRLNKIKGQPFKASEIEAKIDDVLAAKPSQA
jgi:2-oxoglutarate ferredoxin oxidoreductase subunit alpha